jgi:hypothetical protein
MRARSLLLLTMLLAAAVLLAPLACAGPYSGAPEAVYKPKEKKAPDAGPTETQLQSDSAGKCEYDFDGTPIPLSKRKDADVKAAKKTATNVANDLEDAKTMKAEDKKTAILDAMGTLQGALKKDPYSPSATYQLAVAYALLGKEKCALALLQRVADLDGMDAFKADADKVLATAADDEAFKAFAKKVKKVLGQ